VTPELVVDCRCVTGECPLWHPLERRLYWVDIPACRLHRYDPAGGAHDVFETQKPVGGFTIQADGALLLFMAQGTVQLWRDGETRVVLPEVGGEQDSRFNDVIADPEGRVFCGTMSTPARAGRLYRLHADRAISVAAEGIGTSNGMGFTPDRRGFYHTDTRRREIYLYDYDRADGGLSGRRVFARVEDDGAGRPDGLTVDADGCVWSARWDGWRVVRHAPDGREIDVFRIPVRNVSCVTFGGDDYRDLYITTAGGDERPRHGPHAGALFRLKPGSGGVAEFFSRITAPPRS